MGEGQGRVSTGRGVLSKGVGVGSVRGVPEVLSLVCVEDVSTQLTHCQSCSQTTQDRYLGGR